MTIVTAFTSACRAYAPLYRQAGEALERAPNSQAVLNPPETLFQKETRRLGMGPAKGRHGRLLGPRLPGPGGTSRDPPKFSGRITGSQQHAIAALPA